MPYIASDLAVFHPAVWGYTLGVLHVSMHDRLHMRVMLQVIDETDRLLRQAYQYWLPFVAAATADVGRDGWDPLAGGPRRRVLKIVASATLTRDPSKIERLGLHCPRYIALGATDHRRACPALDPPASSSHCHIVLQLGDFQRCCIQIISTVVEGIKGFAERLQREAARG